MTEERRVSLAEQLKRELGDFADTELGLEMLDHLDSLAKDEDVNWIDLMVWRLTNEGVPLPKTIQILAARAAERRLRGTGKLPTKVMKEFTERLAHTTAAFLQGALGMEAEKSYDHAANAVGAEVGYAGKAAVVSKGRQRYLKDGPVAGLLTEIGAAWAQTYPDQVAALEEYHEVVTKRPTGKRRGLRDTDDAN